MSDVIESINTDKLVFLDDDEINYEVATDMIGNMVALYAKKIYDAEQEENPDEVYINSLLDEQGRLFREKMNLRIEDRDAVKKATEYYGKILRDYFDTHE